MAAAWRSRWQRWFGPPPHQTYERELRAVLLRQTLLAAALLTLAYLLIGLTGLIQPLLYPWDGLGFLAICLLCFLVSRLRSESAVPQAASWLVAGVNLLATFNSQAYGIRHPVTALYLPGIVLAGMLIGGWFMPLWTILGAIFILVWGVLELNIASTSAVAPATPFAVQTTVDLIRVVGFWWLLMALTGWLVRLFARTLEQKAQIARAQTAALTQVSEALTAEPALDKVLGQVLAAIARQLRAEWATIYLYKEQTESLSFRLGYGNGQIFDEGNASPLAPPPLPAGQSALWQELLATREPLVIEDVRSDQRLHARSQILEQQIETILYVPLIRADQLLGFFSVNSPHRRYFSAEEIELAQALVQQATLALQLTELAQQAQAGVVHEERNRLAREIHDTLAQGFTGIVIQLEAAEDALAGRSQESQEHLERARDLARLSLAEARRSVRALRPQPLEGADLSTALEPALRQLAEQMSGAAGPQLTVRVQGDSYALNTTAENELLRIAQEALYNALQHAGASRIDIALNFRPQRLTLTVEDDGRGFADSANFDSDNQSGGFGLLGMQERAARIGAQLKVEQRQQGGTRITCELPRPQAG